MHSMMIEKPCAGEMGHTIFFSGIRRRDKSIYELHRRLEHMHVCLSCKETARESEKKHAHYKDACNSRLGLASKIRRTTAAHHVVPEIRCIDKDAFWIGCTDRPRRNIDRSVMWQDDMDHQYRMQKCSLVNICKLQYY